MSLLKIMTEQTAGDTTPIEVDEAPPDGSVKETGRASSKNVVSGEDGTRQGTALYAATNLESWETDKPHYYARDVGIDGTCFRRLDPAYYAWLRYKMGLAKKAADSERLSAQAFEALRTRFNAIHAWAIERFGEDALRSAVQALDPKAYSPPTTELPGTVGPRKPQERPAASPPETQGEQHLYPKDHHWPFTHPVPPSAVAKVDAVRDHAISLGWSEVRLYQNRGRFRFPCGQDYGLVCFLDENERIGEVTRQYIEIIGPPPRENRLRFYNPDVDQPWLKKTKNEK